MTSEPLSNSTAPPDSLSDIAALIRVAAESGEPAAKRAAEALDRWRRSRTMNLEDALGAAPGLRAAIMQRAFDEALQRLANAIRADIPSYERKTCRSVAKATYSTLRAYRLTRWKVDRSFGRRPDGLPGLCFDVMMNCADDRIPSAETIRKIVYIPKRLK